MNRENEYGVILEAGASDWQIFQRDDAGLAAIPLAGRFVLKPDQQPGRVTVRNLANGGTDLYQGLISAGAIA